MQPWQIRGHRWDWRRTLVMGVLNVTPDSFSDGGLFVDREAMQHQIEAMLAAGVDVIDVGGESSRPGAAAVDTATELARVIPAIESIRALSDIPISVDTTKSAVLKVAIASGADILNDISAGRFDPDMLLTAAALGIPVILMHMQGEPRTMQQNPQYDDVVHEVFKHLQDRCLAAQQLGIEQVAIDPGIGFGKTLDHNLSLLRALPALQTLGYPVLVGVSRKRFIGTLLNKTDPQSRDWGTAATCAWAIMQGAQILRVHNVAAMVDVARMLDVLRQLG